jgi:hypothetical protein
MKSSIFWDITQCSPLKVSNVLEEHVASIFRIKPKHEASKKKVVNRAYIREDRIIHLFNSSQPSVDFKRTSLRFIPEDRTLHTHRYENF